MQLKNQVNNIEQGKRLAELGIAHLSIFSHQVIEGKSNVLATPQYFGISVSEKWYPAFTVSELFQMLPDTIAPTHIHQLIIRKDIDSVTDIDFNNALSLLTKKEFNNQYK